MPRSAARIDWHMPLMQLITRYGLHLRWLALAVVATVPLSACTVAAAAASISPEGREPPVKSLQIRLLSTMLAGDPLFKGIGEWGFSALVDVDGRRFLFDTGLRSETVLRNAKELGLDLSDVEDVIFSHHHGDHAGGLLTLRRACSAKNPSALSRVHVSSGIFWSRGRADNVAQDGNPMISIRAAFEATGGRFVEHAGLVELAPGVWFTGPVPRRHPERNWSGDGRVKNEEGRWIEDNVPEDASLVFDTVRGLVVLSGCGHAGIVNTLEYARAVVRAVPVVAAVGGFHLFNAAEESLAWTSSKLRECGVRHFLAAHCTGIEATYRVRELAGLDRRTCVVAAVGSGFDLGGGIEPLLLAK